MTIKDVEAFAAANSSSRSQIRVANNTSFAEVKLPVEVRDRLEEGAVITFPQNLIERVLEVEIAGHTTRALVTKLRYANGALVDYLWYPQTWVRSYRALDQATNRTASTPTTWGGDAATYADTVRKEGYDKAVQTLLGRSLKASNCHEIYVRGWKGSVNTARVFDMSYVPTDTEALSLLDITA